jgi:DHA1 family bicyclomycin/chloramphenicol resistance-like MFS transporter
MAVGCAYMAGAYLSARLVVRQGALRTLQIGVAVALLGTLALALGAVLGEPGLVAVIGAIVVVFVGTGLCLSNAQMGAISEFPQAAGGASAVFGFLQTCSAAASGFVVGQLYDASVRPTAFIMLAAILVATGGVLLLRTSAAESRQ